MAPDSWKALFDSTLVAAREERISKERLDDAVRRILRVKFKLGLMGDTAISCGNATAVGARAHLDVAREAVAKSLVLLKNNGSVLPIRPGAKVLIAGPGADNMAMQAGGWTTSWQGSDTKASDFPKGQTIGRAIASEVSNAGGKATLSPTGTFTAKPDVAIIILGEKPYAEFEGDIPHLAFQPDAADIKTIETLKAQGVPVVALFLSGRPLFAGKLINLADAFVAGWLPGSQGQGVADVLVAVRNGKAKRDFTGKLPSVWPTDARAPIAKPLFDLGYGLSYASKVQLGRVNEEAGVDLSNRDATSMFMLRGKVPAPWRLVQDGSITSRAVDIAAQEDARQFIWSNAASLAIEGAAVNLPPELEAGSSLLVDRRIDTLADGPLLLSLGGGEFDIRSDIVRMGTGKAIQTRIPLRCFKAKGAKLGAVGSAIRIQASKGSIATIRNVRIELGGSDTPCPQ
jgi:beta-glucosidase